ncbi:precorrin-3B methylase [Rhizobium sp. Root274]|uniref:precorrin-3B C(17)-methyltransferase n=1 Tax=unclassified Rhizobium TaxID=2613769 RepID=UPI0007156871|nr:MULTISPECIES: precorrin-3B C(17)-methyltransferase [unclassified Rhizobium]KQW27525.1 precorrin-3B methylase [Rhizobium sp. Root1240]KRD27762.1 precorrin-3B methylase [Rhizobium sp. Root274]
MAAASNLPHVALKPAVLVLNETAASLGRRVAAAISGELHGAAARVSAADVRFVSTKEHAQTLFSAGRPIIAVMASGALIRLLAPLLADKQSEPPVLAMAEDGSSIVPLLGGHHGANDLARRIATALGAHAAITTAGDLKFGVALDQPPEGYVLANPERAKAVMAELVAGEGVRLDLPSPRLRGEGARRADEGPIAHQQDLPLTPTFSPPAGKGGIAAWLTLSRLPFEQEARVTLSVTEKQKTAGELELVYHPKTLVLGMGCERHASSAEAIALAEEGLAKGGFARESLAAVCSIDLKADETAIHAVAAHFGVPARFFTASTLEAEASRLKNPSEVVFAEVGCHGVAEGAALAAVGAAGELVVEKIKSKGATAAIARAGDIVDPKAIGRARGTLFVVGIGPGSDGWRSPEVSRMVAASTDLVGYSLYLDLLGPLADGKTRHDFDLGKEEARVVHAMELAGEGKTVALVCSGDAGIYAMATLVFELFDKGGITDAASRIEVQVSPGISALQAAAARIGAPLGHDFCTISLSDLLTPWEHIQRRVKAAGEGDFVIAFYNPVSMKRRTQLAYARDELLKYRPGSTPVILATNLGRDGETVRTVPLGSLNVDDVDMLTVVVVGSSESRTVTTGDGKTWVYTPRGYSGKADTGMKGD